MSGNDECVKPAIFDKCTAVIVDVLGTTTSIDFAKETLFPFASKHAEETLKARWESDELTQALKDLGHDETELDVAAAAKLVGELTEAGDESAGLKTIQGLIYQTGYDSGALKSHVFDDVPAAFESWSKSMKVHVYSTGSKNSQKQLFAHTVKGDLTAHITEYFDQSVGLKTDGDSYRKIVGELGVRAEEVLFISDRVAEVKAALAAGLSSVVIARGGNARLEEDDVKGLTVIGSFLEVKFENPQKRKVEDEPVVTEEPPSKVAKTDPEAASKPEEKSTVEAESAIEVDKEKEGSKAVGEAPKPKAKPEEKQAEEKMEVDSAKVDVKKDEEDEVDSTSNESKEDKTKGAVTLEKEETKVGSSEAKEAETEHKPEVEEKLVKEASAEVTSTKDDDAKTKVDGGAEVEEPAKVEDAKVEESTVDESTKKVDSTGEEEKENKKHLANGMENGEKEGCALNGEASTEKTNGDPTDGAIAEDKPDAAEDKPRTVAAAAAAAETAEELKAAAKKAEAAPGAAGVEA